jgi:hypothetical protein
MAQVKLFLSSVSAEFGSYRERLRHGLTRPNVEVKVQEDFIVSGNETLSMLDDYIKGCDGVIHVVGDMTGSPAEAPSLTPIKERYPDLATRLPLAEFLQAAGPKLPYTQWEAWLALCCTARGCSSPRPRPGQGGMAATSRTQPNRRCSKPTWTASDRSNAIQASSSGATSNWPPWCCGPLCSTCW